MPPRIATLSCVIVVTDDPLPAHVVLALSRQIGGLAHHAEIVVVADGVGADAARELTALTARVPDMTVHFLADAVERDVATLIGMDRALGDWVVVMTPTEAEVACLPALLAATEDHQLVFAAAPGDGAAGGGLYGMLGRLFFAVSGRLAGVSVEWPTPRLRAYSRGAARWLANRLDGPMLMRSLAFRGAFPGRRIELPSLAGDARPDGLRASVTRAVRQLSRIGTVALRVAVWLAVAGVAAGVVALAYTVLIWLTHSGVQPGWTTLAGLLSVMMIVFSALFALLTGCILALYASIQPRARMPVVREVHSGLRRLDRSLDVTGGDFGAPADVLPVIRPGDATGAVR